MKLSLQKTCLAVLFLITATFHAQTTSSPALAPSNDDCINATPIEAQEDVSSSVEILGDFNGSTLGTPAAACSGLSATAGDIWYTFTANGSRYILDAQSSFIKAELYQGGDCTGLTFMYCTNGVAYLDDLVAGNQYYLKLIRTEIDAFFPNINLISFRLVKSPEAPANDLCDNAILLTGTPVSANLVGANLEITTLPGSVSPNTVLGDVWFKFVATENYALIAASPANTMWTDHEVNLQLYTGSCDGLTLFQSFGPFDTGDTANTNQLQIGQTYYIRVLNSYVTESWAFTINATPKPSPVHDVCDGANNVPLDTDGETQFTVGIGNFTYATPAPTIPSTCNPPATQRDVWYKFTATNSGYIVNSNSNYTTAYSGDCGTLAQLGCGASFPLTNLSIGQTVYLRLFTSGTITIREFVAADECDAAVTLVPSANPAYVYSSTIEATAGSLPTTCIANSLDVWFQFTATSTKHKINVTGGYGANANTALALTVYSGDCNNLAQMDCFSFLNNGNLEPEMSNFVVGETYYIKATRTASTTFGIKIIHVNTQANDLLENASEIIPGNAGTCTLINGSTEGSVPTDGISYCSGSPAASNDIWYWFNASAEKYKIALNTTGFHHFSLYKETASGILAQIYCDTGDLAGFDIGAKYYIRIAQGDSYTPYTFTFCISQIDNSPANDGCADAAPIAVSPDVTCTDSVTGNFTNATYNMLVNFPSGCGDQDDKDVWYRFTPATTKVIISNTVVGINNSIRFSVIQNNCDVYSCVATGSVSTYGNEIISGLTPGVEYLLAIRFLDDNDFSFCLSTPPAIPNDNCADAIVLTPSDDLSCTTTIQGYSGLSTITTGLPACASNTSYKDVWYQFTATHAEHSLHIPDGSGIETIKLFTGSCGNLTCFGNTVYSGNSTYKFALFSGLSVGTSYYIRIVQTGSSLADYSFCLNTPMPVPANNEYANAIDLISSGDLDTCNPISGHFNRATFSDNVVQPTCATGSNPNDLWYKFTATAPSHQLMVHLNNPDILGFSFNSSLYTSSGGAPTQQIFCFNQFDTTLNASLSGHSAFNYDNYFFLALQNYSDLTVGETYYVRLYPWVNPLPQYNYNAPVTFDICLKTLPPVPVNKDVTGAIPITVSDADDLQYVSGYATRAPYFLTEPFNPVTNPCAEFLGTPSNMASNVWFTFTANYPTQELHVINDADVLFPFTNYVTDTHYPLNAALYEYNGTALEVKQCYADTADGLAFENLEVGKQYFLKMMYTQIHYITDFEFEFAISPPEGLGIHSNDQTDFTIYPNPAENVLNISAAMNVETVVIYDLLGRITKEYTEVERNRIDVSSLASGVYLARVNGQNSVRFVKQ